MLNALKNAASETECPIASIECEAANEIESLKQQLAESQARDAKRIEIIKQIAEPETEVSFWWQVYARDALAIPNDATALNELIEERTEELNERYNNALNRICNFEDTVRELRQQNAELQSTRLQMITDFGQYQGAHENVKYLTAQRDELLLALENIAACPGDNRLTTAIQWAKAAIINHKEQDENRSE